MASLEHLHQAVPEVTKCISQWCEAVNTIFDLSCFGLFLSLGNEESCTQERKCYGPFESEILVFSAEQKRNIFLISWASNHIQTHIILRIFHFLNKLRKWVFKYMTGQGEVKKEYLK